MSNFPRELALNSWPMYGVGMFIILLRTVARWRRVQSVTALAPDDWIMMTAVPMFYTTLVVCLNVIASGGGSNLYLPEEFATFTEKDIQERIKGSKIVVVSEQAMLNLIWSLKCCMLFMYSRMMNGTNHTRWIKAVAVWVVLGWVAVEIAFFTACRPFKGYWGMPPPDPQCTTLQHYSITQAVFNLSSDCLIIAIPLPMITSLTLPLKQKFVLGIVFSMGTFVIIAAILTKVYNLSDVYDTAYMLWYVREASVAVYVANLPGVWPLLREHISFLRSHASNGNSNSGLPRYGSHSQYGNVSKLARSRVRTTQIKEDDEVELGRHSFSRSAAQSTDSCEKPAHGEEGVIEQLGRKMGRKTSLDSDERALNEGSGGWKLPNLEVHVNKTVEVQRDSWDGGHVKGGDPTFRSTVWIEGPDGPMARK